MKLRNVLIVMTIAILVVTYSSNAEAENKNIVSKGRIVFDNETLDDSSDDVVIFDASDFIQLEQKIDALAQRL